MDRLREQVLALQREALRREEHHDRKVSSPIRDYSQRGERSVGSLQREWDGRNSPSQKYKERSIIPPQRHRRLESPPRKEGSRRRPSPQWMVVRERKELLTSQNMGNDVMSRALHQISCSLFSIEIKNSNLHRGFSNHCLRTTMESLTPWSMLVIIIRAWISTLRMRHWFLRLFLGNLDPDW